MAKVRHAVVVTHKKLRETGTIVQDTLLQLERGGFDVTLVDTDTIPDFGTLPQTVPPETEIVVVLGGDGTILRAAELVHCTDVPIIGINMGHVGFLAEFESFQLEEAIRRICDHDYRIDERMVAHVDVWLPGTTEALSDWALNDVTIERADRGKMVEMSIGIDGVAMSSFGCDGVIVSTPTGSTAYAFSAGGPIIWPDVQALLMVSLAAHALFSRPIVIGSTSTLQFTIHDDSTSGGWICCDGRRQLALAKGTRVEIRQSASKLRLARLSDVPFTNRLVTKFNLPVEGWREQNASKHEDTDGRLLTDPQGTSLKGEGDEVDEC